MTISVTAPAMLERLASVAAGGTPDLPSVFLDNAFHDTGANGRIASIDPATEQPIATVAEGTRDDVRTAAANARDALNGAWGRTTPQERGQLLLKLADAMQARSELLAQLETLDVGKPISAARGDVNGSISGLVFNAGAADKLEGSSFPLGQDVVGYTELEPLGVTGHIMPWNFPLGMVMRSLAPALAAGCTAVLKPAEQTPLTTLALGAIAAEIGLPPGVITIVTGYGDAGAALTEDPDIDGITFTGSVATGRKVGAAAGGLLKPVVLELGGKNPMIVFEDADLDAAVEAAIGGAFNNTGQVCSSSSRIILHSRVREAFLERFIAAAGKITVGPGMDDPRLGPLVSSEQYEKVTEHVAGARGDGASLLLGGGRPDGLSRGYFVAPTVFDNVDRASRIATEETFGPVVTCFAFDDEDDAVALANGLRYGLVAGVYTRDVNRGLRIVRALEAGSVWLNGWWVGGLAVPSGGMKDSGVGRERGMVGVRNYTRMKSIGIRLGA